MQHQCCLDYFGEAVITTARDAAIANWDAILRGDMSGPTVSAEFVSSLNQEQRQMVEQLIVGVVDSTLHFLLVQLETVSAVKVTVTVDGVKSDDIAAASDGLPGELYGRRGWIARFSYQRAVEQQSGENAAPLG